MAELEYIQKGDFLFTNLAADVSTEDIGKYGRKRLAYLKEQREKVYTSLLLSGELHTHLADTNRRAKEQIEQLVSAMAAKNSVTEALKAADQMEWVRRINNLYAAAEEVVLSELLYC